MVLQQQASPVPIPLQVVNLQNLSKVVFTSKRYFSALGGSGAMGNMLRGMQGSGNMNEMQQQMMNNPELMNQLMSSPHVQNAMQVSHYPFFILN